MIARAEKVEHALCYLDLDQFKAINDSCGHVAGDEFLRQVGRVLQKVVSKRDTLARLGGDEFGVLLERCKVEQAKRVAYAVLDAVDSVCLTWEDRRFRVGVSIGLVPIDHASQNVAGVLRAADAACYAAKEAGRTRSTSTISRTTNRCGGACRWIGSTRSTTAWKTSASIFRISHRRLDRSRGGRSASRFCCE